MSDLFDLTGQVAIITGGAGLLGMQHATAIAEAGGVPVIADLSADAAQRAARDVGAACHVESMAVQADVTSKIQVTAMVDAVLSRFGRIDILINNAALTVKGGGIESREYFAPFEAYPQELWERALQVNLTGAF